MILYYYWQFLIHLADPQSQPVLILVFTDIVFQHVHPTFQNYSNAKQISSKSTMFTTGTTEDLAKGISDSCTIPEKLSLL